MAQDSTLLVRDQLAAVRSLATAAAFVATAALALLALHAVDQLADLTLHDRPQPPMLAPADVATALVAATTFAFAAAVNVLFAASHLDHHAMAALQSHGAAPLQLILLRAGGRIRLMFNLALASLSMAFALLCCMHLHAQPLASVFVIFGLFLLYGIYFQARLGAEFKNELASAAIPPQPGARALVHSTGEQAQPVVVEPQAQEHAPRELEPKKRWITAFSMFDRVDVQAPRAYAQLEDAAEPAKPDRVPSSTGLSTEEVLRGAHDVHHERAFDASSSRGWGVVANPDTEVLLDYRGEVQLRHGIGRSNRSSAEKRLSEL